MPGGAFFAPSGLTLHYKEGGVLDNPATVEDVEARWSPITDVNLRTNVETWIDDSWRAVKRIPRLVQRLEVEAVAVPDVGDRDLRADVVRVICESVIRVLKNPKSLWQFSVDDGSAMLDRSLSSGALYISDAERAMLMPEDDYLPTSYSIPLDVPYWGS